MLMVLQIYQMFGGVLYTHRFGATPGYVRPHPMVVRVHNVRRLSTYAAAEGESQTMWIGSWTIGCYR